MSLKGHVALVTGAGDGIGAETARRLAEEAASVLAVDVNGNGAAATAADIEAKGGTASWMEADVSKAEDVANMVQRAVDTYGTISILVNNAYGSPPNGVSSAGSALDLDPAGWDFAMAIGLRSHFLAAKHALPHMIAAGGGSIVNISSVHGLCSARGNLAYSSLKAGVMGLTRQLAVEFGPRGVRVNAICPGLIVKPSLAEEWGQPTQDAKKRSAMLKAQYPVGGWGEPRDIANGVKFLCSTEAKFISGHSLVIDGGLTIQLQEDLGQRQFELGERIAEQEAATKAKL